MVIMMLLMMATRGHVNWLSSASHLPDFTLPALFITGVYFKNWLAPIPLILLAVFIDWYVISYNGVSDFCISEAYMMLLPAFYMMFIGGRLINSLWVNSFKQLLSITLILLMATGVEWFISSASFYWTAPYLPEPTWVEFLSRVEKYAPEAIRHVFMWMVVVCASFTLNHRFVLVPHLNKDNA